MKYTKSAKSSAESRINFFTYESTCQRITIGAIWVESVIVFLHCIFILLVMFNVSAYIILDRYENDLYTILFLLSQHLCFSSLYFFIFNSPIQLLLYAQPFLFCAFC